ncbi:MAG: DUF4189 domain-containing protein [Sphingomonadales bacterium]|nr:DUF4189 domain-containing protein [Sphingomonadales bacterium]MBD3774665.1 DUF4189 domain-containing protein [Paracoccaceae bacterium]
MKPALPLLLRLVLLVCAGGLWQATPAAAQAYPCPGPGPGEVMVGMTPGGNGVAPVPLCARVDDAEPEPAPVDTVAAIAWHPDAADVWVDGRYTGKGTAVGVALDACNRAMGGGCSSTGEWWNSTMAIIRDNRGDLLSAWQGNGGAEGKRVLADCAARQLLPCEVIGKYSSATDRHVPGARARKAYLAAAWVKSAEGYDSKLYIVSGRPNAEDAAQAAVQACQRATGRECAIADWSGSGFIQPIVVDGGESLVVETSSKRARDAAKVKCKRDKSKLCQLQQQYSAREPGTFVHDYKAGK